MSFRTDERSPALGEPIELYRIKKRNDSTACWFWTTAAYDINYSSDEYKATPGLSRGIFEETDDTLKSALILTMPAKHEFPLRWLLHAPDDTLDLIVFRGHNTNFVQFWTGVLKKVSPLNENGKAVLNFGPRTDTLQSPFILRTYQRSCDVPLYSAPCGLSKLDFEDTGYITAISGETVTVEDASTQINDYYNGGWIEANNFKRRIKDHALKVLTLVAPIPGVKVGMPVRLYAGCDKTRSICISKFSNGPNFRGMDWIPDNEPFTQGVLV